ncbi:hypothetical protein JCM11641_006825 [Rhodosporidiobolus odoratus]
MPTTQRFCLVMVRGANGSIDEESKVDIGLFSSDGTRRSLASFKQEIQEALFDGQLAKVIRAKTGNGLLPSSLEDVSPGEVIFAQLVVDSTLTPLRSPFSSSTALHRTVNVEAMLGNLVERHLDRPCENLECSDAGPDLSHGLVLPHTSAGAQAPPSALSPSSYTTALSRPPTPVNSPASSRPTSKVDCLDGIASARRHQHPFGIVPQLASDLPALEVDSRLPRAASQQLSSFNCDPSAFFKPYNTEFAENARCGGFSANGKARSPAKLRSLSRDGAARLMQSKVWGDRFYGTHSLEDVSCSTMLGERIGEGAPRRVKTYGNIRHAYANLSSTLSRLPTPPNHYLAVDYHSVELDSQTRPGSPYPSHRTTNPPLRFDPALPVVPSLRSVATFAGLAPAQRRKNPHTPASFAQTVSPSLAPASQRNASKAPWSAVA